MPSNGFGSRCCENHLDVEALAKLEQRPTRSGGDVHRGSDVRRRRPPTALLGRLTLAIPHAASGDVINVAPLGEFVKDAVSTTLVRVDHLEVFRLVLPAGKLTREHEAAGTITIQCIEGVVELDAHGRTQTLRAGSLVYLADHQPHAVKALEDASLLITMLLHRK